MNHNLANEYLSLGEKDNPEALYNESLKGDSAIPDGLYMVYTFSGITTCLAEKGEV